MSYKADVFEVLIASPSDVQSERDLITRTIHEWNNENSEHEKVVLLPVRWETHANTEYNGGNPQEVLNRQFVRRCDILVGAMRSKLGTPTRKAQSGTVEEIEEFIRSNKPVKLFISGEGHPDNVDPDELKRLRQFIEYYKDEGIYKKYLNLTDLKDKVRADLTAEVRKLKNKRQSTPITEIVNGHQNAENKSLGNYFFVFHANTERKGTGKMWHEFTSGSYLYQHLKSDLCQASIKKLTILKEKGQLRDVSVLGLYYGAKDKVQNGVLLRINDFIQSGKSANFTFEYIEDTGVPSRVVTQYLGGNYSKHDGLNPQLIVNVGMDMSKVLEECRSRVDKFKLHETMASLLRKW